MNSGEMKSGMILRSMLFVPGDSERKLVKGAGSGADALVLDLEDAVAADRLPLARTMVREYLAGHRDRSKQELWVRCNPLSTEKALPDLAAIAGGPPDGILLPKTTSAADVVTLDHFLGTRSSRRRGARLDSHHGGRDRNSHRDVHPRHFRGMQSTAGRDDLGRRGSLFRARRGDQSR